MLCEVGRVGKMLVELINVPNGSAAPVLYVTRG